MTQWPHIAVGYATYLALLALASRRFVKARRWAVLAAGAGWLGLLVATRSPIAVPPAVQAVLALSVLLGGYRLSGCFFVQPMTAVEDWLLKIDERLLDRTGIRRWYRSAPAPVPQTLELAYLLVYAMAPAGAVLLLASGHADELDRFWATVLLAGFVAYGALPWIQTRPPRAVRPDGEDGPAALLRRVNLAVLNGASIQVNTVPSGHAAVAFAVALAVRDVMPVAGGGLLGLASIIVVATVLGRYHYAVDSLLGVLVAFGAWSLTA